jgi:mannose-6-phosphate isomerase-like protein (cupin superfamily)
VKAINLADKLSTFSDHYRPRTVGQFNGHDLMVVKLRGPFVWHKHDDTDDFFLVLQGRLRIQLRTGDVSLGAGELFVVPRGVEHCPVADEEVHVLLIEPTGTPNTGEAATAAPRTLI